MSKYTDADIEYLISETCEAKSEVGLKRAFVRVADALGVFAQGNPNPTPIQRLLWGLAVNLDDREIPEGTSQRNGPLNYFDETMVKWAVQTETKSKVPITKEKLARILRRDLGFVQTLWSKYDGSYGRKPFFPAKE